MARRDREDVAPLSSSSQISHFIKWKRATRHTALLHEAGSLLLGLELLFLDRSFFHWRLLPGLFFRSSDPQLPRRLPTRPHHDMGVCDYLTRHQLPGNESSGRTT